MRFQIYSISGLMIERRNEINPFGGYFHVNEDELNFPKQTIQGELIDCWGKSVISGSINQVALKFDKQYAHEKDLINYVFTKKGDMWIGNYCGHRSGVGQSSCQVFETSFILPNNFGPKLLSVNSCLDEMLDKGLLSNNLRVNY